MAKCVTGKKIILPLFLLLFPHKSVKNDKKKKKKKTID